MNTQSTNLVGHSQSESPLGRIFRNAPGPVDRAMSPNLNGYSAATQNRGLDAILDSFMSSDESQDEQLRRECNDGSGLYSVAV